MIRLLCAFTFLICLLGCNKTRPIGVTTKQVDCPKNQPEKPAEESPPEPLAVKDPKAIKALEITLKKAEEVPADRLFAASLTAYHHNRLEDSAFLLYAAHLRARFDKKCFRARDTGANSPFNTHGSLCMQIGHLVNPAVMAKPELFANALERLKEWNPKAPDDYHPGYEYAERKTEEEALEATKTHRDEFMEKMTGYCTLLHDPEYFAAFQIHQQFRLNAHANRPTEAAHAKAVETMTRIENEKGIVGLAAK